MSGGEAKALAERITDELDRAIERLGHATLANSAQADAEFLRKNRDALSARVQAIVSAAEGRKQTRIHGDLHLGQVLVTGDDVMIIDFEGEPARALAERRSKDLPQRDVAGMLRSFDYAAAVARRTLPAGAESWEERAEHLAGEFRKAAPDAFLEGYAETAEEAQGALLEVFLLEKAAYEVGYEAANRPDWVDVPAAGLAQAARKLLGDSE